MRVRIHDDVESAAEQVVRELRGLLQTRPDAVVGLPVGRTALPVYARFVAAQRSEPLDLSALRIVLLDEFVGLGEDDARSHRRFLRDRWLEPLGLGPEQLLAPPASGPDLPGACERFEEALVAAGGIDLQLLGLGVNGHLGFNEPGSSLASPTRVVTLTRQTLREAAVGDGSGADLPELAVTLGIGTLRGARRIVLAAFGEGKAATVQKAIEGPLGASCPASSLQLHHDVTVVLDAPAASALDRRVHYLHSQRNEEALARGEAPTGEPRSR